MSSSDEDSESGSESGVESASESGSECEVESDDDIDSGSEYSESERSEDDQGSDEEASQYSEGEGSGSETPPPPGEDSESGEEEPAAGGEEKDDEPTISAVDLDALEEERIKLEERILPFKIFTERKNLGSLGKEIFEATEHEKAHKVEELHAEMEENNDVFDSFHQDFMQIAEKLEAEDEAPPDEDEESHSEEEEEKEKEESAKEDDDETGEEAHKGLEAAIREHAGEDALSASQREEDSESEEEEEEEAPALPKFSDFKTAAEKAQKRRNKRGSGSKVDKIMKKRELRRCNTAPSRPGEEHLFFDWYLYKKTGGKMPPPKKLPPAKMSIPNPALEDSGSEFVDDDDPAEPERDEPSHSHSSYADLMEIVGNNSTDSGFDEDHNNDSGLSALAALSNGPMVDSSQRDDATTFRSRRNNNSGPKDRRPSPPSRSKSKSKSKRKISRSKTAPPGAMRRPGEEFFDWKKFAKGKSQLRRY